MKKIFTILLAILGMGSISAQTTSGDLEITFKTLTAGNAYKGTIDLSVVIKNVGTTTLKKGEDLVYTINLNNTSFSFANPPVPNKVSFVPLANDLKPSEELLVLIEGFGLSTSNGADLDICVVFYGVGNAKIVDGSTKPFGSKWDANFSDNSVCIDYTPDLVSIDELKQMVEKVFFANNQIVFDWTNINEAHEGVVKMINLNGQVVVSEKIGLSEGRNTLDVNNLAKGLYLVSFEVNGEVATTKVFVK